MAFRRDEDESNAETRLFDNWIDDFGWETSGVGTATNAD